jgi:hypothetical protein
MLSRVFIFVFLFFVSIRLNATDIGRGGDVVLSCDSFRVALTSTFSINCTSSICVTTQGGVGPYNYTWSTGVTQQCLSNVSFGVYAVTVESSEGCVSTASISVTGPEIVSTFNCSNQTTTLEGPLGYLSYNWTNSSGAIAGTSRVIQVSQQGTYQLVVTSFQGSSCSFSTTISAPSVVVQSNFYPLRRGIQQPFVLTLINNSAPAASYLWSFGDGATATTAYPQHQYNSVGRYNICLTTMDFNGCTSTFCDTLGMDSIGNIYIKVLRGFSLNVVAPVASTESISSGFNNIQLAPNPATNHIGLMYDSPYEKMVSVAIYNSYGLIIRQSVITNNSGFNRMLIDISDFISGLYYIKLTDDSSSFNLKFMKE